MKRIIFIMLLSAFYIISVKADELEYYYRFYKEDKVGEYLEVGENEKYQYEDDEIIYGEYGDYQENCPVGKGYDTIYSVEYTYSKMLPVKYVRIDNKSDKELDIDVFEFNEGNYMISYEVVNCVGCINNGNMIEENGYIVLKLDKEVELKNLQAYICFFRYSTNISYELTYSYTDTFTAYNLIGTTIGNSFAAIYTYSDFTTFDNYTLPITGYDIEIDEFTYVIKEKEVCKSREALSFHYNLVRNYYDDNYYKDNNELLNLSSEEQNKYIKDLDDYIVKDLTSDDENAKENATSYNTVIPVKTGVNNPNIDYSYLVLGLFCIMLIVLYLIKFVSNKKNI